MLLILTVMSVTAEFETINCYCYNNPSPVQSPCIAQHIPVVDPGINPRGKIVKYALDSHFHLSFSALLPTNRAP